MVNLEISYKIKMPAVEKRFLNQIARAVWQELKMNPSLRLGGGYQVKKKIGKGSFAEAFPWVHYPSTPSKLDSADSPHLSGIRRRRINKELNVSLVFVSPFAIKKLNQIYRNKNAITDVLSFPGVNEIVICYARAKSQAKQNQTTLNREIGWLFVHGLLHLLGFTHETKRKYLAMVRLQEKILKKFKS